VLLGPGDPIRYRPRFSKERFRQVRHEVPCAPCYYMVCPLRGDDHQRCMSRIAPEQMVDAFGEIVTHSS
jgi:ADP-heptose:LPS heptosyltransferase